MTLFRSITGGLAAVALMAGVAAAQTPEEFYKGRTVTLVVSAAAGGGADLYARAFAPFLEKHLPGQPNVVVSNLPGAAGLNAAAQLQTNDPKDGTVMALLQSNNLYLPLLSGDLPFDPREVEWLGSLSRESHAMVASAASPVQSIDDVFTTPFTIGATSLNQINATLPLIVNQFMGGKIDIIAGYQGNDEIALALERGEVMGRVQSITSLLGGNEAEWLAQGKIKVLAQMTGTPHPGLPGVPLITDYIKDDTARGVFDFILQPLRASRPVAVPKGVPDDRLAALRTAFEAAASDPELHAVLAKQSASVELLTGAEVAGIVANLYATPENVLTPVKTLLANK